MLKQAELGLPVADLIRQVGISERTFYRWKKQYSGLESDQARELKQLQDENTLARGTNLLWVQRQGGWISPAELLNTYTHFLPSVRSATGTASGSTT